MAKRFTDTNIWEKKWFMKLTAYEKLAYFYIKDKCNVIGIYEENDMLERLCVGRKLNFDVLLSKCNANIEHHTSDKYWLPDFCLFQYGQLTEECRPHQKYIAMLKASGLDKRVFKGYSKGIYTLQDKDKEKEKDKEKDKDKVKRKKEIKYFLDFIPLQLSNNNFIETWKSFIEHRNELKKPLTERAVKLHMNFLLKQPDPIACIENSIKNQWIGIFEIKENNKNKSYDGPTVEDLNKELW